MSVQPLRITVGRKLAAAIAGFVTFLSIGAGWAFVSLIFSPLDPWESALERVIHLTAGLGITLIVVAACHLLMRAALGRFRTGGSLSRFFRYQLAALGVGCALGLGLAPGVSDGVSDAAPIWWVVSITAAVSLIAVSLLPFRKARHPILDRPPHPTTALAEGRVIDYWDGSQFRAPKLTVVHFVDTRGRDRWIRHLVQQDPSMRGTVGQVVYDRHRPERVLRFTVTQQLFDLRPPRQH
ncbi:hypothetical protein [Brevibacterium spongiae]|uniref:Uncharacterized protein n=1 Tax=Brevibacterium spongiae TaxID=2909672 RepID=A0ABY5SRX3_9MICO|nr:hypothetical protein [Brevibacterium spongiae]UVI35449.1 hypothetical protein L1F31_15195 [Brevibacterium spongiae]